MKNFIFAFLLLAAVIVGVGIYRNWFTVNAAKIQQDENAAKAEMHDLGQQVKSKASDLKDSVKERK
jgi:sensor domain CHASE-containing protein